MYFVGFDIGGSSVKSVLVKNRMLIKSGIDNLPPNLKGLLNLIERIVKNFETTAKKARIGGVGVSMAGALDFKREKILKSPNIKYLNNQPIKKLLAQKLKYPIRIEHDAHSFLLVEKKFGLAKNRNDAFCLTLGSGIGGAYMTGGKILRGNHGSAGEAGHMMMETSKKLEFEDLAANKFIKRKLSISSTEAFARARRGDTKVKKVFHELGKNLGIGIANIINVFDPEIVILAGGVIGARRFIEPGIKQGIKKFVLSPAAQKTKILFSSLGTFGGALGAAFLFEKQH